MILTALLLGAGVIAGIGIVATFWNDLVDFIKRSMNKLRQIIDGIIYGCRVFVRKIQEGIKEISRHYSKVDEHWEETTVTRVVSESEVPPEIRSRVRSNEALDITDELELELSRC